ncbi:hypothetical protein [Lacrimispora sp.]|uniref:hypothetical protein n=1 Tax=Lacrimispora sp. TaxID=2719234 RepID=UPI0028A749C2|nr:hypothetical protein [Lacrimispora sp.]
MGKVLLNNNSNEHVLGCNDKSPIANNQVKALEKDEFAGAFPEWDLVPPLQVIKRVRRTL